MMQTGLRPHLTRPYGAGSQPHFTPFSNGIR